MTREQRRQAIERMLAEDPAATQQQLAGQLGVSQNTISKDIRALGLNLQSAASGRGRPRSVVKLHSVGNPAGVVVTAGEELVAKIRAEMDAKNLEPDAREEGLLLQIRQVADDIAELRERIGAEGLTFKPAAPGGPPRMHPAAAEIRQNRAVLARLLSQISLEESTRNPIKAKAANTRWRRHNLAAAAHQEGP